MNSAGSLSALDSVLRRTIPAAVLVTDARRVELPTPVFVQDDQTLRVDYALRRQNDPANLAASPVRLGYAILDAAFGAIGSPIIIETLSSFSVSSGRYARSLTVSRVAGPGIDVVLTGAQWHIRPFVETVGTDHATVVEKLGITEIASTAPLIAQMTRALLAAASPYPEGYLTLFDPATGGFRAAPSDDLDGLMSLNWFDASQQVSTGVVTLLASDAGLRKIVVANPSTTATVAVAFGGRAPAINAAGSYTLGPGALISRDGPPLGSISIVASETTPVTVEFGTRTAYNVNDFLAADLVIARHSTASTLPAAFKSAFRALYVRLMATDFHKQALYLFVPATVDAEFRTFDLRPGGGVWTETGAPPHVAYRGMQFDGAGMHCLTGRRWAQQPLVKPNNIAMMTWSDATLNSANRALLSCGDTEIQANRSATSHGFKSAATTADAFSGSAAGGMLRVERTAADSYTATRNRDIVIGTSARAALASLLNYEHAVGTQQGASLGGAASHWAGLAKVLWAGPPQSQETWGKVYDAFTDYFAAIEGGA